MLRLISRLLKENGFGVSSSRSGSEARKMAEHQRFDVALLDLTLPDEHGFDVAVSLRATQDCGIVFLTGSTDDYDKVTGLELGGDDYITKPFSERELVARLRSILRRLSRSRNAEYTGRWVYFGPWEYDVRAYQLLHRSGTDVNLTSAEHHLLQQLIAAHHEVVSRETLHSSVTGREWSPADRCIDILVSKIRRKLEAVDDSPRLIQTIRSIGYKFIADVETRQTRREASQT